MHILKLDGAVETPLRLTFNDLAAMDEAVHERDVSRFHSKRRGDGVRFEALLRLANPRPGANYLTLHAEKDDFHVSVPLEPVRAQGVVVYAIEGMPLSPENHGPFRFLIKDPTACNTGELDDCANVKYLDRIEITMRKGRDTRPTSEEEHAALHEREAGGG